MSGTKDNCSREHLTKLMEQRWPGQYHVKGNEPYDKGVEIIRLGEDPEVVDTFAKNNDAFVVMIDPTWFPGKPSVITRRLFSVTVAPKSSLFNKILFYEKSIALCLAVKERCNIAGLELNVDDCLKELRYRLGRLKSKA